jgi:hypothetical protein
LAGLPKKVEWFLNMLNVSGYQVRVARSAGEKIDQNFRRETTAGAINVEGTGVAMLGDSKSQEERVESEKESREQ